MEFKINTKKRIRILSEVLFKIMKEQNNPAHEWFSGFLKDFSIECGLQKTSVIGKNSTIYGGRKRRETYLFKIVDKQKWMLAKIKYGL